MLKKRLATLSISALLGLGLLAGCGGKEQGDTSVDSKDVPVSHESQEPASSYTVTFFVGSEEYDVQTVTSGSYASKPATDPVKEADEDFTYVFDGWYESGAETAWNFETNSITKDLNLFAKFTPTPIEQDLIIWVWGGTDENVYITEEEFARLETEGSKIAALEGKKVAWRYKFGMGNSAFNEDAMSSLVRPDLLISGNNLYKDGVGVPLAEADGYGKIKLGTGWFTNASRYMGVAESTSASHFPLATAVYDLLKEHGPDYFALDHAAVTVKPGASKTVSASYAEGETRKAAFKSADESIATVTEEGVITGVAEGKTFITATLGLVSQEVEVVVDATDYKLVAYVNAGKSGDKITEAESNRIKAIAQEMVGADQPISWNYIAKADGDFAKEVKSVEADLVIGSSNLGKSTNDGYVGAATGYESTKAGPGWFQDTARYVLVPKSVVHNELAASLYALLSNAGPDYGKLTLDKTDITIAQGATEKLEATAYGSVTWTSSDETIATVVDGLVTGVAKGDAVVTAFVDADKDGVLDEGEFSATCNVTVGDVIPAYDLHVVINTGNADNPSKWMTDDNANDLMTAFKATTAASGKNVQYEIISDQDLGGLATTINGYEADKAADIVVGREAFGTKKATKGLVALDGGAQISASLDASWGYETGVAYQLTTAFDDHATLITSFLDFVKTAKA